MLRHFIQDDLMRKVSKPPVPQKQENSFRPWHLALKMPKVNKARDFNKSNQLTNAKKVRKIATVSFIQLVKRLQQFKDEMKIIRK